MNRTQVVEQLPGLRRYARVLTGDAWAADDLVQDTLERACSKWRLWRSGSDLRAWLFGIMHNLRVDQMRRTPPMIRSVEESECNLPTRPTQTDGLELKDLEAALNQLPHEQREVVLLVALEDMAYAEIAAMLGIPAGTVMSRLARGRERLRQIMAGFPDTPASRLRVVK